MTVPLLTLKDAAYKITGLSLTMNASDSDGNPDKLDIASLVDRTVILFVLGIDCSTCRRIAHLLSEIRDEYAGTIEVVGVCVHPSCRSKLDGFAQAADTRLHLGYCPVRELCVALGVSASTWLLYPTLIFIDQEHRLRGCFIAGDSFFEKAGDNIRYVLNSLVSEHQGQVVL